jgi:hypothetical protein
MRLQHTVLAVTWVALGCGSATASPADASADAVVDVSIDARDANAETGADDGPTSCPVPSAVVPGQSCTSFAQDQSCPTSIPIAACDGGSTGLDVSCSCIYGTWVCNEYPVGCATSVSEGGDGG